MEIITAFIFLFFVNSIIYAQNISTAIRISADYNKTYLIIDDPILTNSTGNIGAYTSIWGFRAGISCDKKVYKAFSMESEIGYSSGGFYGKYFYRKNVNQI